MTHPMDRLYRGVHLARGEPPSESRTAQLLRDGNPKIAKKVVEEAAEVALDAVTSDRDGVIRESVDLLYNLTVLRSEEHTSELQSLMRISYAVFCLKKKNKQNRLSL